MNGVHDMGGLECFGPIATGPEDMFNSPWEKDVLALTLAMGATGSWNLDESRSARESLPPDAYLSIGYYRIWLSALENLLVTHQLLSEDEVKLRRAIDPPQKVARVLAAKDVPAVLAKGSPVSRHVNTAPALSVGDKVVVRNRHLTTHTRLPAYIRNQRGTIYRIHGAHVFPDSHAIGRGEDPQWLYNVRFEAAELWGEARSQASAVHVDCWEPYLHALDVSDDLRQAPDMPDM